MPSRISTLRSGGEPSLREADRSPTAMEPEHTDPDPGRPAPTIGVLAIQGSFDLHIAALRRLGIAARKVRYATDLDGLDGIVLPGGESTVLAGVSRQAGLYERLRRDLREGLPAFGTCAGAILLGRGDGQPERLGAAPVILERNAYGRQAQSFERAIALTPFAEPFPAIFIRAPRIRLAADAAENGARDVEILGRDGDTPVLVRYRDILLATFHPELTDDLRLHRYFADICAWRRERRQRSATM